MNRSIRLATLQFLIAAIPLSAPAGDAPPGNTLSPRCYWPGPVGTRMQYESARWNHDGIAGHGRVEMICGKEVDFQGSPAREDRMVFRWTGAGEPEQMNEVTVYQAVNDSISCCVGMRFGGGGVWVEDQYYVDLKAPLELGAAWTFVVPYPSPDPDIGGKIDCEFVSEVVETGATVKVPAGTFTDCMLVQEKGRSVEAFPLRVGPHAGEPVRFEIVVKRWWCPGLGSIRETISSRTISADDPDRVLAEFGSKNNLVSVARP